MRPINHARPFANLDARRSHRFDLMSAGEILLRSGREACKVLEISRNGARIETNAKLRPGDDGLLRCDGLDLLFFTVRVERKSALLEFIDELAESDEEIDPELAAVLENNYQILRFLDI